jgi:hypothetical protein
MAHAKKATKIAIQLRTLAEAQSALAHSLWLIGLKMSRPARAKR